MKDYEWLSMAMSLAVGRSATVQHSCGNRPSMQVGHSRAEFWAYCHRCGARASRRKEYVMLQRTTSTPEPSNLPEHLLPLVDAESTVQDFIRRFLVARGINAAVQEQMPMFVQVDAEGVHRHERLYMQTPQGWVSRAVVDSSVPKVRNHRDGKRPAQTFAVIGHRTDKVVIVEDLLSAYKVRWATGLQVLCALGTKLSPAAVHALLELDTEAVTIMLDGDDAGRKGAVAMQQNLTPLGFQVNVAMLPEGKDPRELSKFAILTYL